jgi:hypothetical protein
MMYNNLILASLNETNLYKVSFTGILNIWHVIRYCMLSTFKVEFPQLSQPKETFSEFYIFTLHKNKTKNL